MNWASARSSRATPPQRTAKRALAIRAARSRSSPSAAPTSSWGFGGKANVRGSLQWRTSTLSSSPLPSGTDGWGRFGSWSRSASRRSSTPLSSASSAITSETSSAPPLVASPRRTTSGCSRICRTSSTALLGFDRRGALRLDARDRADPIVGLEVDDTHAPRVASLRRHIGDVEADHLALRRDDQDVVALAHLEHGDDVAVAAAGLDVDDSLAGAALQAILVERRALAEAPFGDGEDADALQDDVGGDDLVALVELDALHAAGAPPHRAHFFFREADAHAELGRDHDLALAVGASGRHHPVVIVQSDRLDPTGARMRVRLELGLLDRALLGREQDVAAGGEIAHRHTRRDHLALTEREEIHHGLALGLTSALGNLVHLQPVDLAAVGEEQEIRVRRRDEEVLDDVLFLRLHAGHALAAAALAPVRLDVGALDVARA